MTAINIIKTQPELRARLWRNVAHLKSGLQELGRFDTLNAETHIIPILIGEERVVNVKICFSTRGILAHPP